MSDAARTLLSDLLGRGAYARDDAPFRTIDVSGPDAAEFLQRLCAQDVSRLTEGGVTPAAFLDAKGKLLATCLVCRSAEGFWLEVQAHQEPVLRGLLERYHFTEKLRIEPVAPLLCTETVVLAGGERPVHASASQADAHRLLRFQRRGVMFVRQHGDHEPGIARPLSAERAECVRMLAGLVRVGVETEPSTLALEVDLDDHISTTKGCYTGQEIVARIHTYGHTNRKLCLLLLAPGAPITSPQPLHETEDRLAVGRVMQAVPIPDRQERLGVGYLPKDFQVIGTKLALADGSNVEVIGYEPLPPLPA